MYDLIQVKRDRYFEIYIGKSHFLLPVKYLNRVRASLLIPGFGRNKIIKILFLCMPNFILSLRYKILHLGKDDINDRFALVIPWNQRKNEKVTCFIVSGKKVLVQKYAFSKETMEGLRQEVFGYKSFFNCWMSKYFKTLFIDYFDNDKYCFLELKYVKGKVNYVNSICFNRGSVDEIELKKHPLTLKMIAAIKESQCADIRNVILKLLTRYENCKVGISKMHGDFTRSNILSNGITNYLIDFEDFEEKGIPMEEMYFEFRKEFEKNKVFYMQSLNDFLVVFYYIYFQLKNKNERYVKSLTIKNDSLFLK